MDRYNFEKNKKLNKKMTYFKHMEKTGNKQKI